MKIPTPRARRGSGIFGVALIAAALAGCATEGGETSRTASSAPAETAVAAPKPIQRPAPPKATAAPPIRADRVVRATPPASPPPPKINDDPNQLLGLTPDGVAGLLGAPTFVRRDGPAEIWQYQAPACILDVFLYSGRTGFQVTYVELRGRGARGPSRRECFAAMLMANREGQTS
jgi:hypothetical protein